MLGQREIAISILSLLIAISASQDGLHFIRFSTYIYQILN